MMADKQCGLNFGCSHAMIPNFKFLKLLFCDTFELPFCSLENGDFIHISTKKNNYDTAIL